MENIKNNLKQKHVSGSLFGAALLALLASSCCILPLVLVTLGIGGAWVGNLTAFEPYRPIFIAVTLSLLGFAFYKVHRKPKIDCACDDVPKRKTKTVLWVVTFLVLALLTFPYFAPLVFGSSAENISTTEEIVLELKNMTCFTCTITVKKSLTKLEGVSKARVTLNPPEATVTYDSGEITTKDLIQATTNAGYPSVLKGDLNK